MGNRRSNGYKEDTPLYTPAQVEAVLNDIGVDVVGETHNDFLCYCPYHGNNDTPAFSIGKYNGIFYCFNGSCGESGHLIRLVKNISGRNDFEAMRLISKMKGQEPSLTDRITAALQKDQAPDFPQEVIDRCYEAFWNHQPAIDYMHGRGYDDDTLKYFKVGWSDLRKMIMVPVHNVMGTPIGVVGRSITEKKFKNHKHMNPSRHMFNLHRAKRQGETCIIQEASLDVIKTHQAGFPYVVGTIGGYMNEVRFDLLKRHFTTFIIMTDDDDPALHVYKGCRVCYRAGFNGCRGHNPGLALGRTIAEGLKGSHVLWATHDYKQRYPKGKKDPGELEPEQIAYSIKNAVTDFEFRSWNLSEHVV